MRRSGEWTSDGELAVFLQSEARLNHFGAIRGAGPLAYLFEREVFSQTLAVWSMMRHRLANADCQLSDPCFVAAL